LYTLVVITLVSTLHYPAFHEVRDYIIFNTDFACRNAKAETDIRYIEKLYEGTHAGSHVALVTAECERTPTNPT
jgi:hypothetical protein